MIISCPLRHYSSEIYRYSRTKLFHCWFSYLTSCLQFTQASEPLKVVKGHQLSQRAELLLSKPGISSRQIKSNIPLYNKINKHLDKYLRQEWAYEKEVVSEGVNNYTSMQACWFLFFLTIGEQWAHLFIQSFTISPSSCLNSEVSWTPSVHMREINFFSMHITIVTSNYL